MAILNLELIRRPLNWAIIGTMVVLGVILANQLYALWANSKPQVNIPS